MDTATGGFCRLPAADQGEWLHRVDRGEVGDRTGDAAQLSQPQMRLWFEDVRAEIARAWTALPAAMDRIGYDGFAVGGDGQRMTGYNRTGADHLAAWQHHGGDAA